MIVVDSSAVIAVLRRERDAARIAAMLATTPTLRISAVSVLECRMVLRGRFGEAAVGDFDLLLANGGFVVHPFDADQSAQAYQAFRRYGKGMGYPAQLNMADCAAYALATSLTLPLLFIGDDFARTDVTPALTDPHPEPPP